MANLNETYESQREIEEFVDDAIEHASKYILMVLRGPKKDIAFSTMEVPIKTISKKDYGTIQPFIEQSDGKLIIWPLELGKGKKKRSYGAFSPETGSIRIKFPYYDILETNDPEDLSPGQIEVFFNDDSLTGLSTREVMV